MGSSVTSECEITAKGCLPERTEYIDNVSIYSNARGSPMV